MRLFTVFGALLVGIWIPFRFVGYLPPMELEILFDLLISAVSVTSLILYFKDSELNPRHLSSWLHLSVVADVLCVLPLSMIAYFAFAEPVLSLLFINLLAARHIAQIKPFLDQIDGLKPMTYRLIPIFMGLPVLVHVVACFWIFLGSGGGTDANEDHVTTYVKAFYWAMTTLTTVGYGDITPKTNPQMLFAASVQIMGVAIFGYLLSSVASLLARTDAAREHHMDNLDRIETFMRIHKIPAELKARTRSYFHYLWMNKKGYSDRNLLRELPAKLQSELYLFINRSIVEKVPFLKGASNELIEELMSELTPRIAVPGEKIFRAGDPGDQLYFIQAGDVEIIDSSGEKVATLTDGSFFGEMALLSDRSRSATAVAQSYTELYQLSKHSFQRVIRAYPTFKEHIEEVIASRTNPKPS